MKIETQALDNQQTKLIAELDGGELDRYKQQAARKISQSAKIPGFRPGKAPYDVIRRMYGEDAIQQEALEMMLKDVYPQALKEAKIDPSGPGQLEEIISTDPPTFAFVVPLQPVVSLGEYKEIRKEYAPEEITDDKIEATLRRLQRSYATAEPVDRPAEKGDMVSFMLSARRTQIEEGENELLVEETPYQMAAGEEDEDQENPWPYEGFTQELLGVSANEVKTVMHTFDEESPYPDLQGKEAEFVIRVETVKQLQMSELTDEFATTIGDFETLDALRLAIRTQLQQTNAQQYDQTYFDELVGALVDQATIQFPPHMLDEEVEEFMHNLGHNLERDNLDMETYLKMREMNRDDFVEQEVKPAAKRRLERALVLEEFARSEAVTVSDEETRSVYYAAMQQAQLDKTKKRRDLEKLANSMAVNAVNNIFNQRLTARLKNIAIGKADEPEVEFTQPEMIEAGDAATAETIEAQAEDSAPEVAPSTEAEMPVKTAEVTEANPTNVEAEAPSTPSKTVEAQAEDSAPEAAPSTEAEAPSISSETVEPADDTPEMGESQA